MTNRKLTVIIPFINEKYEVENTIISIQQYSSNDVDILIINDASDDGFNYKQVAKKHKVRCVENAKRLGVAASRDLGVELCQTPYFLFLDAHMRFYDNLWIQRIIIELDTDQRSLLCCQTRGLMLKDGLLVEYLNRGITYGALINLNNKTELINASWANEVSFDYSNLETIPIVCVLGAGYACSKSYWQYLKGLKGLKYYGSDEPYISMKVLLEGGSCKLLKDVVIGHIYRTNKMPYSTDMKFVLYNQLLIVELLFPEKIKKKLFAKARLIYSNILPEVLYMLYDYRETIAELKQYYQEIFTRDYSFFEVMNNKYKKVVHTRDLLVDGIDLTLSNIASLVHKSPKENVGIQNGRMGAVIYLFHYGRISIDEKYTKQAEKMLDEFITSIQLDFHYGFATGLAGIGWAIEYLYQEGFIEGDINEILEDFDKRIMEINPQRMLNLNRDYGLGGIVCYLLARLYTIDNKHLENPFDQDYLRSIYDRIVLVIKERNTSCDSVDLFLEFINFYENKQHIVKPEIIDVCPMSNPQNIHLQDLSCGLNGVAGVGLKLLFEKVQSV